MARSLARRELATSHPGAGRRGGHHVGLLMAGDPDCVGAKRPYVNPVDGADRDRRSHRARTPSPEAVLPPALQQLLHGANADERDTAWRAFVDLHSKLLLHVARTVSGEHDSAMDAYAYVLERLCEDGHRRLRGYEADGRSRFSTWLVVVARRLCLDHQRHRYGRARSVQDGDAAEADRAVRRRLVDLTASSLELASIRHDEHASPDQALMESQLHELLGMAMSELEPLERLLLKFRFEDGLTAQEIATLLRWPTPFHVFRRLNAIYARLRRALVARGVEGATP